MIYRHTHISIIHFVPWILKNQTISRKMRRMEFYFGTPTSSTFILLSFRILKIIRFGSNAGEKMIHQNQWCINRTREQSWWLLDIELLATLEINGVIWSEKTLELALSKSLTLCTTLVDLLIKFSQGWINKIIFLFMISLIPCAYV